MNIIIILAPECYFMNMLLYVILMIIVLYLLLYVLRV